MEVQIVAEDLNGPGVHRVDLQLDGMIIDTFEAAAPQAQLEVAMHAEAPSLPGASTLTAVAYRQDGTDSSPVTIALTVVEASEQAVEAAEQALAAAAPAESDAPLSAEGSAEESQSTSDLIQLKVSTTSDWTNVYLVGGGEWQDISLTSASEQADFAGPANGGLSLTQSLARAEAGRRVELVAEAAVAGLPPGRSLVFEIERGHVGSTEVEISRYRSGGLTLIAVMTWDGINADEQNTESFEVEWDGTTVTTSNENVPISPVSEPQQLPPVSEPPPATEAECPAGPGNCCGDGVCQTDESGSWCGDCPAGQSATEPVCGDGTCNGDETYVKCPADCLELNIAGITIPGLSICGDGACTEGESHDNCPDDCLEIAICGDGVVEGEERCDPPGEVWACGIRELKVCNASCTGSDPDISIPSCGNGVPDCMEECDPPGSWCGYERVGPELLDIYCTANCYCPN